jgi:hypothetical protein
MEIFRLEHKITREGPFNYRFRNEIFYSALCDSGVYSELGDMTTPRDDGLGEDFRDYFKFGFKNMPCFNKWFKKHLWFFKDFNFVISCYEVNNMDIRIGCEQVVYNSHRAQLKWEREIET